MFRHTSSNSCVDRLNTEGDRDSALWLVRGDPHLPGFLYHAAASKKDYA